MMLSLHEQSPIIQFQLDDRQPVLGAEGKPLHRVSPPPFHSPSFPKCVSSRRGDESTASFDGAEPSRCSDRLLVGGSGESGGLQTTDRTSGFDFDRSMFGKAYRNAIKAWRHCSLAVEPNEPGFACGHGPARWPDDAQAVGLLISLCEVGPVCNRSRSQGDQPINIPGERLRHSG